MNSILIVDDNRQVLEYLEDLLRTEGYDVSFVPRGEFIFQRLAASSYDLILLDINLPGRSGIEWLNEIKSHPDYRDLPVIMITGEDEDAVLANCFEVGASDYIQKPINQIALTSRIRAAIAVKQLQEQRINLEKQKALEARMMMLTAQMNPHFIFNSLNSIQYFLLDNDGNAALNFLSEFAGLMRKTLSNSNQRFISVSEELEFLRRYLDLEKQRFQGRFDYRIENGLSEPNETLIPPMLLQPYIENSIVHGFKELKDKGLIELSFSEQDDQILVTIRDNGIGREAARKIRSAAPHRSVAMSNTQSRLDILKSVYDDRDFDVTVRDLVNNEVAVGTEVMIRFSNDLH